MNIKLSDGSQSYEVESSSSQNSVPLGEVECVFNKPEWGCCKTTKHSGSQPHCAAEKVLLSNDET